MTRQILIDQPLPAPLPVARVEVRRITMAADLAAGTHVHNGPVFGVIESGSVIFQVANAAEVTLVAGDVFYEPAGMEITRFDATSAGAVFLAYFPLERGQEPEVSIPAG
jgi:quercetin dioxygenase-like cupin family protein